MGTVSPQELLRLWQQEQATSDMVIGHLVQHVVAMESTLGGLTTTVAQLRQELARLSSTTGPTATSQATTKHTTGARRKG